MVILTIEFTKICYNGYVIFIQECYMWSPVDKQIKDRIKSNIVDTARTRLVIHLTVLALFDVAVFVSVQKYGYVGKAASGVILGLCLFIIICLTGVFYIYFASIQDIFQIVEPANMMCVGRVVNKVKNSTNYELVVKVPDEKVTFKITTEPTCYKNAEPGSRVLVLTASKKLESKMYGVDPASFDRNGIL